MGIPDAFKEYREILAFTGSALAGTLGIAKTVSEILRSRVSVRDKLLTRIQGLIALRQSITGGNPPNATVTEAVEYELTDALRAFAETSRDQKERQALRGTLTLFQRTFLWYRPIETKAWAAHLLFWLVAVFLPLAFFGTWFSEGSEEPSWEGFVASWKEPGTYFSFFFFLGVLLLARLWALSERKKYVTRPSLSAKSHSRFGLRTIAGILYGALGVALFLYAGSLLPNDLRGAGKMLAVGVVVAGCGLTLQQWDAVQNPESSMNTKKAVLLALPAALLAIIVLFDVEGIVLKDYTGDVLGYWHRFLTEPVIILVIIPLTVLPMIGAIRCFQKAKTECRKAEWMADRQPAE